MDLSKQREKRERTQKIEKNTKKCRQEGEGNVYNNKRGGMKAGEEGESGGRVTPLGRRL